MQTATTISLMLLRLTGLVQIILGLLFWTGNNLSMIPVHMLVGFVLVLALWTLAGLAARAGGSPGFVAFALLWGAFVPVLGLTQQRLLPGDLHWLIQVAHLLVGLAAIGLGENLAAGIKTRQAPVLQAG
jgi:hypothetical protein